MLAGIDPNLIQPWYPSPVYADYAFATPEFLFSFGLLMTIGLACAPHVINNVLAARETKYFKWAPLIAFVVYLIVMILVKLSGLAVRVLVEEGSIVFPDVINSQDFAFMYGVGYAAPNVFIWGIFTVIVLAAVMSTTDRLMLTIGTMFSWDIYKNILHPHASDKEVLLVSRIAVFAAAGISLILAINPPEMLAWLIWMGIGVMLSTFAVPILAGLYWRGATTKGALAAMAIGLISSGIAGYYHQYITPLPVHFSLYSVTAALLAMILVSWRTEKNNPEVLDTTMTGWYIFRKR